MQCVTAHGGPGEQKPCSTRGTLPAYTSLVCKHAVWQSNRPPVGPSLCITYIHTQHIQASTEICRMCKTNRSAKAHNNINQQRHFHHIAGALMTGVAQPGKASFIALGTSHWVDIAASIGPWQCWRVQQAYHKCLSNKAHSQHSSRI